jgi:phage I-like protein
MASTFFEAIMSTLSPHLATLVFELAANAEGIATEAHLLPPGPFRATDGRPYDCEAWLLNAEIAGQVIARMAAKANDTLIDYEHQSLRARDNGQKVLAAGWFKEMQWRDGKGLYAVNIDWNNAAKAHIQAKEYRYISTVFFYYERSGEVLEVVSVALTNTPALDGLDGLDEQELAVLSQRFTLPSQEHTMPKPEEQLAALTQERDGLAGKLTDLTAELDNKTAQLAALTAERDTLKAQVEAAAAEQAQAALTAVQNEKTRLLAAAAGTLPPALLKWAERLNLADLTEYLEKAAPLALTTRQADPAPRGQSAEDSPAALVAAATRYQTEQASLGITVSDIDAILYVNSKHV